MKKGFTLIELMIVIAIIAILAAIAIPNLMESRIRANEANAVAGVKEIAAAQVQYETGRMGNARGFAGSLDDLYSPAKDGNAHLVSAAIKDSGSTPYQGYEFDTAGTTSDFDAVANPTTRGSTGRNSYWVGQAGTVYVDSSDYSAGPAAEQSQGEPL